MNLTALSQFDIPVETKWLGNYITTDYLETQGWLDTFTNHVSGIPVQLTKFYHSTPSYYILKAAYYKGILYDSIDQFSVNNIFDYLTSLPSNFFSVFVSLHRNERDDLQNILYQNQGFKQVLFKYIKELKKYDLVYQLVDISKFVRGIWISENKIEQGYAFSIIKELRDNIPVNEWNKWGENATLGAIVQTVTNIREIDRLFTQKLYSVINYNSLGQRSSYCGLSTLRKFMEFADIIKVDPNNIQKFFHNFNFRELGKRSKLTGLTTIRTFMELARRFSISKKNVNEFCQELDPKLLGEKINASGLATLNRFMDIALSVGVNHQFMLMFCSKIDFEKLPSTFAGNGISTVRNFLRSALVIEIEKTKLQLFTNNLDYKQLALLSQKVGIKSINELLEYNLKIGTDKKKLQLFCTNLKIYPNEQKKYSYKVFESLTSQIFP